MVLRSPEWWNGGLPILNLKVWPPPTSTKANLAEQAAAHTAALEPTLMTLPEPDPLGTQILVIVLAYLFFS